MHTMTRWTSTLLLVVAATLTGSVPTAAQPAAAPAAAGSSSGYAVEYYYKVKWGHFDEFMELYKKNHYPILQREQALGRILRMEAAFPRNHAGEASRWDLRFTIVWKDIATTGDGFDTAGIIKELYPDQATFKAEEQRRFALLLEHMDVPVRVDNLSSWK